MAKTFEELLVQYKELVDEIEKAHEEDNEITFVGTFMKVSDADDGKSQDVSGSRALFWDEKSANAVLQDEALNKVFEAKMKIGLLAKLGGLFND